MKPSAKRGQNEPAGVEMVAMTVLVTGSMRASTPEASVMSQILPAPTVTPPSELAGPIGIVA